MNDLQIVLTGQSAQDYIDYHHLIENAKHQQSTDDSFLSEIADTPTVQDGLEPIKRSWTMQEDEIFISLMNHPDGMDIDLAAATFNRTVGSIRGRVHTFGGRIKNGRAYVKA